MRLIATIKPSRVNDAVRVGERLGLEGISPAILRCLGTAAIYDAVPLLLRRFHMLDRSPAWER